MGYIWVGHMDLYYNYDDVVLQRFLLWHWHRRHIGWANKGVYIVGPIAYQSIALCFVYLHDFCGPLID